MVSMSGSWFFVVASEAISVGNTTVTLPGVGSYIALAIEQKIWWRSAMPSGRCWWSSCFTTVVVPAAGGLGRSLSLRAAGRGIPAEVLGARRAAPFAHRRVIDRCAWPAGQAYVSMVDSPPWFHDNGQLAGIGGRWATVLWTGFVVILGGLAVWQIASFVLANVSPHDAVEAFIAGLATLCRVLVLIAIARDLGADRRDRGNAAAAHPIRSAGGAIPGGVSGQRDVSGRGIGDRRLQLDPIFGSAR